MIRKVIIYSLLFFTFSIHADELTPKAATQFTKTINQSFLNKLPFNNKKDFEDAKKNFIGNVPNFEIKDSDGRIIWSMKNYAFLLSAPQVPSTVNPSLWRISKLNMNYGLYQVKDNIYQVRGSSTLSRTLFCFFAPRALPGAQQIGAKIGHLRKLLPAHYCTSWQIGLVLWRG